MRTVSWHVISAGDYRAVFKNAARGTYTHQEYTVLDAAGRVTDKLGLNGYIVIESGYYSDVLCCLDTGEIVRIEAPDDW